MKSGFVLSDQARDAHVYVPGQSGTGKSRAIASWALQDLVRGHGLAVLDIAEDLFNLLLFHLTRIFRSNPAVARRLVVINPLDPKWTVGLNPLAGPPGIVRERLVSFLSDVIISIWKIEPAHAPRMVRLLAYSLLALSELGLSLVDLRKFLCNTPFRASQLQRVLNPHVREYFAFEFPTSPGAINQWIGPILHKIERLLFDPDIRLMFAAGETINFRRILDERLILLVNLSKGSLAPGNSDLLGAFIVSSLQQAATSRANSTYRPRFYLYLDEFQDYTTSDISVILAQSRKYGLSLTLAHQYLSQIPAELRGAVLNNTGTIVCFRIGHQDATLLAKEIFPVGFERWARGVRELNLFGLPCLVPWNESQPLTQEEKVALLTDLRKREFWVKSRGPSLPVKQVSLEVPDPAWTPELLEAKQQLLDTSGTLYGRLKQDVRGNLPGRPNGAGAVPVDDDYTDYDDPAS